MVEVGPRVGRRELVRECGPRADGGLGDAGHPSMSLRSAIPCQWTLVSAGRALSTVTRSKSPALARSSGPGTLSPYAQVCMIGPPRSTAVACGVSLAVMVLWPARRLALSARWTACELAVTGGPDDPHPATPPRATAPKAPNSTVRRVRWGITVVSIPDAAAKRRSGPIPRW